MENVVQVRGVSHRYRGAIALHEVDVDLRPGVTAVLGPNGAGKSTFLGVLSTALRIQRGSVDLGGIDSVRDRRRYRAGLGFLPQSFTLPTNLTVREFLGLTAWQRLVPRAGRAAAVEAALDAVDLAGRRDERISALSGGMHRRVGIAQAVVNHPRLLLLDEPTVGLDPRQRRGLRELVPTLGADRAVVISTHLTEDVAAMADRVLVLAEGAVRFDGTVHEFTAGRGRVAAHLDAAYEALVGES
ncbi:ABC transporter ATP-binding protein [Saccharothrix violaceirubra]|uniref:ABC-2 type transport system ATP-binding protein n=1 Tax=Saccharothrix violaceirubra TaxID=413306 RepID=A0A7W7WWJ3_9PSEU|nr:ATP-binding cassette domain-containing protein [Saccharothrix violaceirubra]MBB4966410.1 ABC-2 type transport system ATP-binding protein [Saccharothrix violaceirubra]